MTVQPLLDTKMSLNHAIIAIMRDVIKEIRSLFVETADPVSASFSLINAIPIPIHLLPQTRSRIQTRLSKHSQSTFIDKQLIHPSRPYTYNTFMLCVGHNVGTLSICSTWYATDDCCYIATFGDKRVTYEARHWR